MKTIYYGGQVYTGQLPLAEAFIVEGDKFSFAGSSVDALSQAAEEDRIIDLEGKFVCPGFIDSHMHLLNFGQSLNVAPLHAHTSSLREMIECLKDHGSRTDGWIIGRGWNQDYFTDADRMPNRYDLDQVASDRPVMAVRACGHALAVNSFLLNRLGITADSPQPFGGQIVMENGEPNGILFDNAMDPVYAAVPVPDREELKNLLRLACRKLNSYGITGSHSDDYSTFAGVPWQEVNAAYRELEAAGELTVRVYEQSNFSDPDILRAFVEAGNITGSGTNFFRIGPLKMLGDGALGARTAYLSRPYEDDPSTCGIPVFSQETFDEMIGYAHEQGMQVAVHAIGDACLDQVLSAMDKALKAHPRKDHRHGIVHCQITRPDQLEKMAKMGLHIYAQSIFLDYDIRIVEQRAGRELAATSYSWKSLKDLGASVSNGSDCPVELPFVLGGIQCAVTRKTLSGEGPYLPGQAFSVGEALDSFTSGGAYGSFEEQIKGRIRPGMLADFVLLGQNPFDVPPHQIKDIPVLATFLGGKPVFRA